MVGSLGGVSRFHSMDLLPKRWLLHSSKPSLYFINLPYLRLVGWWWFVEGLSNPFSNRKSGGRDL